jgi:D-alanyl-D-alanine carboxypeptidase
MCAVAGFGLLGAIQANAGQDTQTGRDAQPGRDTQQGVQNEKHGYRMPQSAECGPVFEWILLDAETGQVISEQNADVMTYPASLTKMMTLYLTFEALNQGRIRLDQTFTVSAEAANHAPSRLGLTPGERVQVRDLILGLVTKSANDAAAVLAEGLGGTEANFARYMTLKARQLGMQNTWYQNASGLPNPGQRTTARDIARLALALYHQFPREYRYFSTREFQFHGETVRSHDHLLEWYPGADGIKTGFVNASGFNLATSAVRDGHRLVGVIMGGSSAHGRDVQMASLLDQGFAVLASGRPVQSPSAPLVAKAAPQPAAPQPAPAPERVRVASAAPATAAVSVEQAAAAVARAPTTTSAEAGRRSSYITHVAAAALRHLAPVAKAEAATMPREAPPSAPVDGWAVQVGAFRGSAAAKNAARHAGKFDGIRGKEPQVIAPGKHDAHRLYRVQMTHLSAKQAEIACTDLRRHHMACSIIRPTGIKVASD